MRSHLSFWYHFSPSTLQRSSREKPHGSVCSPFWILTVEWAGAWSCLFGWRHRFQIASFSPSTLENSVFKKHRFQIAPFWRAFSNDSVFGDRFRRCSVDDSRIRSKTAPFSFENGLVWTGPKSTTTTTATETRTPRNKMSRTMAVDVRYNSKYISFSVLCKATTWNDPIRRCMENVNHDG